MIFSDILHGLAGSGLYLLASFILFLVGQQAYRLIRPGVKITFQLTEADNVAVAIEMVGYYAGIIAMVGGVLWGESRGLFVDLADMGIYGGISLLFLLIGNIATMKLLLPGINLTNEILEKRNVSAGVVAGCVHLSTGLVIMGAIVGDGGNVVHVAIFWLAGQLVLIALGWLYRSVVGYKLCELLVKNNIAAGIAYAGALVSVALLIQDAIGKPFLDWHDALYTMGIEGIICLAMLPLVRWLSDLVLLPGRTFSQEIAQQETPNIGAGLIEAFSYIGSALLIGWCF